MGTVPYFFFARLIPHRLLAALNCFKSTMYNFLTESPSLSLPHRCCCFLQSPEFSHGVRDDPSRSLPPMLRVSATRLVAFETKGFFPICPPRSPCEAAVLDRQFLTSRDFGAFSRELVDFHLTRTCAVLRAEESGMEAADPSFPFPYQHVPTRISAVTCILNLFFRCLLSASGISVPPSPHRSFTYLFPFEIALPEFFGFSPPPKVTVLAVLSIDRLLPDYLALPPSVTVRPMVLATPYSYAIIGPYSSQGRCPLLTVCLTCSPRKPVP